MGKELKINRRGANNAEQSSRHQNDLTADFTDFTDCRRNGETESWQGRIIKIRQKDLETEKWKKRFPSHFSVSKFFCQSPFPFFSAPFASLQFKFRRATFGCGFSGFALFVSLRLNRRAPF